MGSEPNKLAISDDGKYLYTGLDGSAAVRRVNIPAKAAEIQFSLGSGLCGQFLAEDIVVLKNNPNSVAISKRNTGCSPRHEGVAIYDDGVQRPTMTPGHTGSYSLNGLPPGFQQGVSYVWEMWVYSPDGGYGVSNEYRYVNFSSSGVQNFEAPDSLSAKPDRFPETLPRR